MAISSGSYTSSPTPMWPTGTGLRSSAVPSQTTRAAVRAAATQLLGVPGAGGSRCEGEGCGGSRGREGENFRIAGLPAVGCTANNFSLSSRPVSKQAHAPYGGRDPWPVTRATAGIGEGKGGGLLLLHCLGDVCCGFYFLYYFSKTAAAPYYSDSGVPHKIFD